MAVVDERLCTGCGICVETCAFQAIGLERGEGVLSTARIAPLLCKGCGNCVTACPSKAITLQSATDRQFLAQIGAALAGPQNGQPRILGLLCQWSGYAAADLAGARRLRYPSNVRPIQGGCSARFDPHHILWAFLNGADGVFLGACEPGECHRVDVPQVDDRGVWETALLWLNAHADGEVGHPQIGGDGCYDGQRAGLIADVILNDKGRVQRLHLSPSGRAKVQPHPPAPPSTSLRAGLSRSRKAHFGRGQG